MSSSKQNQHIGKLIVGAMSIDGTLGKDEREKLAKTLDKIGLPELIADVGAAIEEDDGTFNMFEEGKELYESLGADADTTSPIIFRIICDVVASDRFVSSQEASYLSALARRLKISGEDSKRIFQSVMAERRGRLEVSGSGIDELLHPQLKNFLSFEGADQLVGELSEDSLEERLHNAREQMTDGCEICADDVERALTVLGLFRGATLDEAKTVWLDTIETLNLPKMARLGETFVTAGINRITQINEAYKTVLHFFEHLDSTKKAGTEAARLEKAIERDKAPNSRNAIAADLEREIDSLGPNAIENTLASEESF